jgi:phosphate transport system permease protein
MMNGNDKREKIIEYSLFSISTIAILIIIGIFGFLFFTGINAFNQISFGEFFMGEIWNPSSYTSPKWGILSLVVSTVLITIGALSISVPIGLASAIYLSEMAGARTREILKPCIEMVAGIPSVVLGLIGIMFLSPLIASLFGISSGLNALTSSIIVGIMVLPTIISISEDVLTSIPKEFREASLALGATRWQMIKMTLVPAAISGIAAAVMLGIGRAVGETMAVLMVSGNSIAMPTSFLDPIRPLTANIAIEIKEVVFGSLHYEALFATALVLFGITFVVNLVSDIIIESHSRKYRW